MYIKKYHKLDRSLIFEISDICHPIHKHLKSLNYCALEQDQNVFYIQIVVLLLH